MITNRLLLVSRPTWARGLKLLLLALILCRPLVAPHVGAWIETLLHIHYYYQYVSRPTWARGLKLIPIYLFYWRIRRAPRGRVD